MEAFVVGIIVGAALLYFYHKRKQPKPDNNDAAGVPANPLNVDKADKKKN